MKRIKNVAEQGSSVGVQVGSMEGNATFRISNAVTTPSPELSAELEARLADIDAAVRRCRHEGDLTVEDADSALGDVAQARDLLPLDDPGQAKRFVTTMKRIAGVVSGTAELTTTVAEAVDAVQTAL